MITAGLRNFKMTTSRFVDFTEEEWISISIPRNPKGATYFGLTLLKSSIEVFAVKFQIKLAAYLDTRNQNIWSKTCTKFSYLQNGYNDKKNLQLLQNSKESEQF